jgi:hypothetical protein
MKPGLPNELLLVPREYHKRSVRTIRKAIPENPISPLTNAPEA